ncbi:MAG: EipA family protein, partial [Myxococcales bacterium]
LGKEGGGAFLAGVRYGKGTLYLREGGTQEVYWHGPSIGTDFGAAGSRTMFLISNLEQPEGLFRQFTGIDGYIDQAKGPDGSLPADVAYVYAKWLFRRTDISNADRIARSEAVFKAISEAGGAFQLQATYFLGVLAVQKGELAVAAGHFERVLKLPARNPRDQKVHELTNLSLGRVYFEQGKYTEAVDRYQEIDYRSEYFVDALYEIAWTHVRRAKDLGTQEYEKANQACEKLLLAAPDSVIAPEARILQGHLLLKLGRYTQATETYTAVINTYLEVYDNIDGLLKAHSDPVKYFQQLIAESDKTFDISALLPPIAVKWATTQREVADAVRMTGDLDLGRKGIGEANEIAQRLLETLEKRGMQAFPTLQEGFSRAEAVDSALARTESQLLQIEERVLGPAKLQAIRSELEAVRQERQAIEARFKAIPKTEQELEARKKRQSDRIGEVDQTAFRLGYQVESLFAVLAALEKWVADTRGQRPDDSVAE